jgi:hypothetical protein
VGKYKLFDCNEWNQPVDQNTNRTSSKVFSVWAPTQSQKKSKTKIKKALVIVEKEASALDLSPLR